MTNYGQPPRAKPRICFTHGFFYTASGNIVLQFRTGEIYKMPNAGMLLWNQFMDAMAKGEFYNFNVRHVFHTGGKSQKIRAIPAGYTASF